MAEKEKELVEEQEEAPKKTTSKKTSTASKKKEEGSNETSSKKANNDEQEKKSMEEHLTSKTVGLVIFILTLVGASVLVFVKICAICGWYIYVLSEILKIAVLLCSAVALAGCVYKYAVSDDKKTDKTNLIYLFLNAFILLLICL